MSKYLVTGGAGFIGSHICEELVRRGDEVVCVDNLVNGSVKNFEGWLDGRFLTFYNMDVCDLRPGMFEGVDVVFHNAASKCTVCRDDPMKDLMTNAWGSFNVFDCAVKAGVKKVVHAATGSINGFNPKSFYGVSKMAGEGYLKAMSEYYNGFRFTSLRYYHVIGDRQDDSINGGVVPIFIRQALNGYHITIHGDGLQTRHFTSVHDVVRANMYCAEHTETDGQIYDVVSGIKTSILDLARLICELVGIPDAISFGRSKPGDIRSFKFNNKFEKFEYNNDLKSIVQGIIGWYKHDKAL